MRKILKYAVPVMTAVTLVFIFGNSLQSAEQSAGLSGGLTSLLQFLAIEERILRKAAHFLEFALLGAEFAVLAEVYRKRGAGVYAVCTLAALLCAMCDETLQLIPAGRSSEIVDVWLDLAGSLTGIAVTVLTVFALGKRKIRTACQSGEDAEW